MFVITSRQSVFLMIVPENKIPGNAIASGVIYEQ